MTQVETISIALQDARKLIAAGGEPATPQIAAAFETALQMAGIALAARLATQGGDYLTLARCFGVPQLSEA